MPVRAKVETTLKAIMRDCLPPVIVRQLQKISPSKAFFGAYRDMGAHKAEHEGEPWNAIYQRQAQPFLVATRDLRYDGGMAFTASQHHFIQYYHRGAPALEEYYKRHQPRNIFEQHFIESPDQPTKLDGLPWSIANTAAFSGEEGLDHTHGRQQYGPVSKKKIDLEVRRLNAVKESISKFGYKDALGFPRGYFLENDKGYLRFLVVGGQHRTAALSFLSVDPVVVTFQPNWPRIIRRTDVRQWPQVRAGNVSVEFALAIFDAYFRNPQINLWSSKN